MTSYRFGDVVLVPFPFTDQRASKKRPAVVVSNGAYHSDHINLILMAVSSHVGTSLRAGEVTLNNWKKAGLISESVVKAVIATIEKKLVIRKLGTLSDAVRDGVKKALRLILAH
jgi:mRNA interferase MazF